MIMQCYYILRDVTEYGKFVTYYPHSLVIPDSVYTLGHAEFDIFPMKCGVGFVHGFDDGVL